MRNIIKPDEKKEPFNGIQKAFDIIRRKENIGNSIDTPINLGISRELLHYERQAELEKDKAMMQICRSTRLL